jgi:hypothetical protein
MNTAHEISVDEASRLAVTATVDDLEYWCGTVAVDGRVDLSDLVGCLNTLRAASAPQPSAPTQVPALAAS